MAEPTDPRGPAPTGGTHPAPYPLPRSAPAVREAEAPGYRPVALTAVIGLILAVLYAVVLAVLALVAWSGGTPLPLSVVPLVVPLAAAAISALGWLQVQRSEGTRAGGRLALWGLALSLLAGLSYGAYLFASYVALGQQAQAFAEDWLKNVRDGKIDEAYRDTLPPESRPRAREGPELHNELELRFNIAQDGGFRGGLTGFAESDPVLTLNHRPPGEAAPETGIRPLGVKSFEYRAAGYRFELTFEISTPDWVGEILVTVQATEDRDKVRKWYVVVPETKVPRLMDTHGRLTRIDQVLRQGSKKFVAEWLALLEAGGNGEAYLRTQPPDRRAGLKRDYRARLLASTLAPAFPPARAEPLADAEAGRRLYLPGYAEYVKGSLVKADPFWAPKDAAGAPGKDLPKTIPDLARQWFEDPGHRFASTVKQDEPRMPVFDVKDGRLRFYHPFQASIMHLFVVQGALVTETDARALDDDSETQEWRLAEIDLYNGRTMLQGPRP